MKKIKIFRYICLCLAFVFSFIFVATSNVAYATETADKQYSDVMTDLTSDSSFDVSKYTLKETDYSLEFITLAESQDYELFVYVYVPSADKHGIKATSINISKVYKDVDFSTYNLKLLSKNGVFHKYLVENFTVEKSQVRYYEITSIYRASSSAFGDPTNTSQTAYEVCKSIRHTSKVNEPGYDIYIETLDHIKVTDSYAGFMRYPDGGWFSIKDGIDVHFIAFSTSIPMDQLLEADLTYVSNSVKITETTVLKRENGSDTPGKITVNCKDNMSYDGSGWGSHDYSWKYIEKADSFLQTEANGYHKSFGPLEGVLEATTFIPIKAGAQEDISSKQWVIRYAMTDYDKSDNGSGNYSTETYTYIHDISILRLAFTYQGDYYNLGVVHDKVNEDENNPSNDPSKAKTIVELEEDIMNIIRIVLVCVLLAVLLHFVSPIAKVFMAVAKFIIWIVKLPFKLIKTLFK